MRKAFGFISIATFILSLGSSGLTSHAFAGTNENLNDQTSAVDRADAINEIPPYYGAPSRWSVGFRVAQDKFPFPSAIGQMFQLYGEWMLPFQKMGLFSVGGHLGSFPVRAPNVHIPQNLGNFMGGLQFRYQLKYTPYQLFVPTAYVGWDYYRLEGVISNHFSASSIGAGLGLMINLGLLDAVTARDAFQSLSLTRAYLTLEAQPVSLATEDFTLSGNFYFFGIRTEFE